MCNILLNNYFDTVELGSSMAAITTFPGNHQMFNQWGQVGFLLNKTSDWPLEVDLAVQIALAVQGSLLCD